jgi:hypothetical protein
MVFHRALNAVNQFILSIVVPDKIVVHAALGDVISMLFPVSLACNYAIIRPGFAITGVSACIRPWKLHLTSRA